MDILNETWFRLLAGLMVGLSLGSFVTMLSYRVPRKLSIISPPSSCPQCHTHLGPLDLIPVFSWLLSGGKCRHCGNPIGARYLAIEVITTTSVAVAFVIFGFSVSLLIAILALTTLITLATITIEKRKER